MECINPRRDIPGWRVIDSREEIAIYNHNFSGYKLQGLARDHEMLPWGDPIPFTGSHLQLLSVS